MKKLFLIVSALLISGSTFAASNLVCGIFDNGAAGQPTHRIVADLDNDGDTSVLLNKVPPFAIFSVFVNQENVSIGFSMPESAAKTVFSGSKRLLKLMDATKGESIGWISTWAPVGGEQNNRYGVCYYTGNGTKAPFDP